MPTRLSSYRFPLVIIAAVLLGPTATNAQIKDDEAALKTLKAPDGFEIHLFAGADICHNPTAIDVDIYGRVWVAEGVNYRSLLHGGRGPGPLDPNADRIKVFEDTKGTGRADKVTVFTDKIPIVPMSICVAGDQAFFGVAPQFWRFDGAGGKTPIGMNKTVLLSGFHFSGRKTGWDDHDHCIHGLTLGPDGRMYFTVGNEGMDVVDNSGVRHKPHGGAMVRMNLDGTKMRILADNFRNPYELTIDSFGRVFCSDNDDDGNQQVRICSVIDGGDYGYRHNPNLPKSPTHHHWNEDVPGVTPKILRTFQGSPCGMLVYEGHLLPERFFGSLIHCDCGASPQAVVRAYHLKPTGAGFSCEIENLVTSSDKWFRPTDVACAPDGSLYISDWYDSGVGGHGYRDMVLGRIYRLTMKGAPPPAKAPSPDLTTISGLLRSLMSPMPSVRYLAIQKLHAKGPEATKALVKMAREAPHPLERARALWALFGMGEAGRDVILEKLKDSDYRFRAQAVRMLREDLNGNLAAILPLANDDNAEVRLEVAVALRDAPTAKAAEALRTLARKADPEDPWYLPTLGGTLREREPEFLLHLFDDFRDADAEARALAVAWQINRKEMVPYLAQVLQQPKADDHFQKALDSLSWIKDLSAGEAILAAALGSADSGRLRAALETLRRKSAAEWRPVIQKPQFAELFKRCLKQPNTLSAILGVVGAAQAKEYVPRVLALIDQPGLDKALRRAALEAAGQIRSPEVFAKLRATIAAARLPDPAPKTVPATDELILAAVSALHAMGTADARGFMETILQDRQYPSDLRREAIRVLGRDSVGCNLILALVVKGKLPVDLKGDAAQVTNRSPDRRVRSMAARVLPLPKLAGNRTLPPLHDILSQNGDPKQGRAAFFKAQAQCSKCHRVDGVGGWIGPDLSQIGGKLAKEGLLDSILNPSAAIAFEYVQYAVETHKGQVYQGLIVEETPERMVLKNAEGERVILPAKEIASKNAMPVSLMPEGLVQNLTDRELVDLLAFLGTLKQPSLIVADWQVLGPLANASHLEIAKKGSELFKETVAGKNGSRIAWRRLSADREGRLDLEAALGTRSAAVYLAASVRSNAEQAGQLVLLMPPESKIEGWINGESVSFKAGPTTTDAKTQVPYHAAIKLKNGTNPLRLRIVGSDKAPLIVVPSVVSAQGVEIVKP